jgi:microsomal dipeptidase-like Zn-dependent dipeptidase
MDKGNLGSIELVKKVSQIKDPEKQREEFAKMIWMNIFQVVKAVEAKSGWDVVSIGTDYDGTITHVDPYDTSAKMPLLRNDLVSYLHKHKFHQEFWYGYTPEELVDKVFSGNAMKFYEKFFV